MVKKKVKVHLEKIVKQVVSYDRKSFEDRESKCKFVLWFVGLLSDFERIGIENGEYEEYPW